MQDSLVLQAHRTQKSLLCKSASRQFPQFFSNVKILYKQRLRTKCPFGRICNLTAASRSICNATIIFSQSNLVVSIIVRIFAAKKRLLRSVGAAAAASGSLIASFLFEWIRELFYPVMIAWVFSHRTFQLIRHAIDSNIISDKVPDTKTMAWGRVSDIEKNTGLMIPLVSEIDPTPPFTREEFEQVG